jgi:nitrogen fixation protein NifX
MENAREIPEVLEYVQRMVQRPPLWMRRAMGLEALSEDFAMAD